MARNSTAYIANGFQEDCLKLLETFKVCESVRFESFCKVWKEMKFSLVFLCRKNYAEILEFCEESLNIAKVFITTSDEVIDQIGGLYLLYGLYYKIPVENVKIRVTLKEWQCLLDLHDYIKNEKLYDASYIFVKLVADDAFYHCLFDTEYGLEKNFKRQEHSFENPYSVIPNLIEEIENGELGEISNLSKVYDGQKNKLLSTKKSKNTLQLFDKNFMDEIINEIDALQGKREELTGLRKKPKEKMYLGGNKKIKYNYEDKIRPKLGHGFDTDSSDDENIDLEFSFIKTNCEGLPNNFDVNEEDEYDADESGESSRKCFVKKSNDDEN